MYSPRESHFHRSVTLGVMAILEKTIFMKLNFAQNTPQRIMDFSKVQ